MLTTQQIFNLNTLMNSKELCDGGRTAGDLAIRMLRETDAGKVRVILGNILVDEQLRSMEIRNVKCEPSGAAYCVFADGRNEAVVAFRGTTTGREWYDNFVAANQADSAQQQAAREYLDGLDLSDFAAVTLTGHSKGGNKAMYCMVTSDAADRCLAFDGQGFSDAFVEKYAERINDRQGRIENHCAGGDYINILLNEIGQKHYYETYNPTLNFFLNHDLTAMCDGGGALQPGSQDPGIAALGAFGDAYLRSLPARRRDSTLDMLGRIFALILKGDTVVAGAGDLMELIGKPRYRRELIYLFAYILRYERETGGLIAVLRQMLANSDASALFGGIGDRLLDLLEWQAGNPLALWGIASGINILVEDEDWSYLLELFSDAAWMSERIEIEPLAAAS